MQHAPFKPGPDNPSYKHGLDGTYIADAWASMIKRCYKPENANYPNYGGRGIRVCEWLRAGKPNLLELLGHRPSPAHSLDRIDNNGHYSCGQCAECLRCGFPMNLQWATLSQQHRNRRDNRIVEIDGVRKPVIAWMEETGLTRAAFMWRYVPETRARYHAWWHKHKSKAARCPNP